MSKIPMLLLAMLLVLPAQAQMRGPPSGMRENQTSPGDSKMSADGVERLDNDIKATDLTVAFSAGFECEPVSSPFGSRTRYDGSYRRGDRNSGLHGGMDISLKTGTPLLAVAAGEVIALGKGGRLEGIYLWLRHAPADTGLPFWVFNKYQHLSILPDLKAGDRVQAGQPVALSGATGTEGPQYGPAGYPHLHLSTHYGPSEKYALAGESGSRVRGQGATLDDPLILYYGKEINDLAEIYALPKDRKTVDVAVASEDGIIHAAGAKAVWPVRCKRSR
jgi:murein DD-endopeptidase MepM/ murein hydrolase activator NlpD